MTADLPPKQSFDFNNFSFLLGLAIETQKNLLSDSGSTLRLRKIQSRNWSQSWEWNNTSLGLADHWLRVGQLQPWGSENSSLGLGLKTKSLKIPVSDSVLKIKTWSGWSLPQIQVNTKRPQPPKVIEFHIHGPQNRRNWYKHSPPFRILGIISAPLPNFSGFKHYWQLKHNSFEKWDP